MRLLSTLIALAIILGAAALRGAAALAGDLVQSKVDVIFTPWGTAAALAAKRATATIPVVIEAAGDPVGAGIRELVEAGRQRDRWRWKIRFV